MKKLERKFSLMKHFFNLQRRLSFWKM